MIALAMQRLRTARRDTVGSPIHLISFAKCLGVLVGPRVCLKRFLEVLAPPRRMAGNAALICVMICRSLSRKRHSELRKKSRFASSIPAKNVRGRVPNRVRARSIVPRAVAGVRSLVHADSFKFHRHVHAVVAPARSLKSHAEFVAER